MATSTPFIFRLVGAFAAYRKGWEASARSTTFDLDAAERRFEHRYGKARSNFWLAGWTDHASDYTFGQSLTEPVAR